MHPNPAFRVAPTERNIAFARARAFGTLAVTGGGAGGGAGPLLAHVPFLLAGDGASLDLHLVRSNPILRALPAAAVIAVSGPDAYVSPDWYGLDDQVPTWNYVAVHLRGPLERLPQGAMRDMLDRQSAALEAALAPKPPWRTDKMGADALDRLMRQIVPLRLRVEAVDGTWKLNQNKPDAARLGAAEGVGGTGPGQERAALAALMREPPRDPARGP
jgi:transcriptional regulator